MSLQRLSLWEFRACGALGAFARAAHSLGIFSGQGDGRPKAGEEAPADDSRGEEEFSDAAAPRRRSVPALALSGFPATGETVTPAPAASQLPPQP